MKRTRRGKRETPKSKVRRVGPTLRSACSKPEANDVMASVDDRVHVIVIGGGVAGLTAALTLLGLTAGDNADVGRRSGSTTGEHAGRTASTADCVNVTLLEARGRLGGRIHTAEWKINSKQKGEISVPFDLGAAYIHGAGTGNAISGIVDACNDPNVRVEGQWGGYAAGFEHEKCPWYDTSSGHTNKAAKKLDMAELRVRMHKVRSKVERIAHELATKEETGTRSRIQVRKGCETDISVREALDKVEEWRSRTSLTRGKSEAMESLAVLTYGFVADIDELGTRWHADLNTAADDEDQATAAATTTMEADGAEAPHTDQLVASGFTFLVDHLAERLKTLEGDRFTLELDSVVREVNQEKNGVVVTLRDGTQRRADYVVVTVPLGVLQSNTIKFVPPLSDAKLDAIRKLGMGVENKLVLRFSSAFWPKAAAYFQCTDKRFRFINYNFFHPGSNVIVVHMGPPYSRQCTADNKENVKNDVLKVLQCMFGARYVSKLLDYEVTSWQDDEFARGSYSYFGVGSDNRHIAALGEPDKRVYFGGEATSVENMQCVSGALDSGVSCGNEVRVQLGMPIHASVPNVYVEITCDYCGCLKKYLAEIACDSCEKWVHRQCATRIEGKELCFECSKKK